MPRPPRFALCLFLCFLLGGLPLTTSAQLPQPRLQAIFPAGGQAGETVEVNLTGTDLEGANALWFDHPGLRGFHIKGTTFRVAIAPGTSLGHHDLCVISPLGISNPRTFVVGDAAETVEKEPNNAPDQANPIRPGETVNGRMDTGADVDLFAFDGKAGQRMIVEIEAFRLESRMAAKLRLTGPDGRELDESRERPDDDPILDVELPANGRYRIQVQDLVYGGSPEYPYRLRAHDGPYLDAIRPVVAKPETETTFTLLGRNLAGKPLPGATVNGRPLEEVTITLKTPPLAPPGPRSPSLGYLQAPALSRTGFEYEYVRPDGRRAGPIFVALTNDPIVVPPEPNDPDHPATITPPCDISGAFEVPGDIDVYRFEAKKGAVLWFEASAERFGSRADPSLIVQRVEKDGKANDIASAEDTTGNTFLSATVDAVLRWQAPEDGTFQVLVSDLYGTRRGDPGLAYRLQARPERPDYQLYVLPALTPGPQGVTLRSGGRVALRALLARFDGFALPVRVEARDLPPGVTMDPIVIGAGENQGTLVFTASLDAKRWVADVALECVSLPPNGQDELHHGARPAGVVWPPSDANHPLVRATRGLPLAVIDPAPFQITARPVELRVPLGGTAEIALDLVRREGFTEAVQITAINLPPNVAVTPITVPQGALSGALKISVAKNATPGPSTVLLTGTGPMPFSKDPNAKQKPNVNVVEPANSVRLIVTR